MLYNDIDKDSESAVWPAYMPHTDGEKSHSMTNSNISYKTLLWVVCFAQLWLELHSSFCSAEKINIQNSSDVQFSSHFNLVIN